MRAELRLLHSPDADPLKGFRPNGPFGILVQAMVGPLDGRGEESFGFMVCTPEWFSSNLMPSRLSPVSGRHTVFVDEFNFDALERFVRDYCASCEGQTWSEVAQKVARLGLWEFEDYKP